MRHSAGEGHSLVELLVVLAIFGLLSLMGVTALMNTLCRTSLQAAATRVQSLLRKTREDAIALQSNRGIRFVREGQRWTWSIYGDGDYDGVRSDDIRRGIDVLVHGPEELGHFSGMATIGIPEDGVTHPDNGSLLTSSTAPVRFNASSICSFAGDGSSTPGSVYLRDINGGAAMVRTSGDGGRIRVLFYERGRERWVLR